MSNSHPSKLLPIVNRIFNNDVSPKIKMNWRFLYQKTFGINPTDCIVCKSKLRLGFLSISYSAFDLKLRHDKITQKNTEKYPFVTPDLVTRIIREARAFD